MSVLDLSASRARDQLKTVLDAADAGVPATIVRSDRRVAVVDADRLRLTLARALHSNVQLFHEADEWAAFIPGATLSGTGSTTKDAIEDLVEAAREHAKDWTDHLRNAPNHENAWDLVQLIELSNDDELRE